MKKISFILALAVLPMIFSACGKKIEEQAQKRADSLQSIIDSKDGEIDALFDMLNQIEANLNTITDKYGKVQTLRSTGIESGNVKGEINEQMKTIENILADNKAKMASLNAKIANLSKENSKMQEFISNLESRMAEQENQIAELLTELENNKITIRNLNENVSNLTRSNQEKDATIAHQINEANKAYFVVGTYKELLAKGIAKKDGGFIGIGKSQGVQSDMDINLFTEIDRTRVSVINVNMKNVRILTQHPEGSYELVMNENDEKEVAYLKILNTAKFWSLSKYLVISTKK